MKFNARLVEDIEELIVDEPVEAVQPGIHFIDNGLEYEWLKPQNTKIWLGLDCWQIWSAIEFITKSVQYFLVNPELGEQFIDWGPCDTKEEVEEFLQGKIDDYEDDQEQYDDIVDLDLEDQFTHLMQEKVLSESDAKQYEFKYSVDGTSYTKTISAPSMAEAEQRLKKSYEGKNCYITSKKEVIANANDSSNSSNTSYNNGNSGEITESLEVVIDDVIENETTKPEEEQTPPPPTVGQDMGVATLLNSLIIDEWEAIDGYNNAVATISTLSIPSAEAIIKVITDIVNEEHIHVGQLQKALELVAPNAISIADGEQEATRQIDSEENIQ